ncbi:hypothetical protein LCGC14_0993670 [marine sediment metagenome]|uniref:Methyltransferase domain-containing protein n=1 Tax=marine sediment metagenome TaxID=412755 RepID=A0A0F9N9M6_9ZZZZ|nr:hypothetical protein [Pricia sp.]
MPSSDIAMIPKVISIVNAIDPKSILDIGMGNGRYGFLFRECLDWNYGRLDKRDRIIRIDGIDITDSYITDVHRTVYNNIIVSDWMEHEPSIPYGLIFMGDVLEHWPEGIWQKALTKAKRFSKFTIVVAPNWRGSIAQGEWHGHKYESHEVVLSPQSVGGKCLFASSKMFICVFDNNETGILEGRDICL